MSAQEGLSVVVGSLSALAQQNLLEPLADQNQAQRAAVPDANGEGVPRRAPG